MPSTCLLITTQNRSSLLDHSLSVLSTKTWPDEVLVVDDGGSDGCEDVCEVWGARYVYNDSPLDAQCSEARNIGIKSTDCDVVITCEPEVFFVSDVVEQVGVARNLEPDRVVSAGSVWHGIPGGGYELRIGWVAPFVAAYERQWLLDVGGWDEQFPDPWGWEDTDLLTRLRLAGHGQRIDPEIEVRHQWHEPRWSKYRHDANEAHFMSKGFHRDESLDIVANEGLPWGVLRTS